MTSRVSLETIDVLSQDDISNRLHHQVPADTRPAVLFFHCSESSWSSKRGPTSSNVPSEGSSTNVSATAGIRPRCEGWTYLRRWVQRLRIYHSSICARHRRAWCTGLDDSCIETQWDPESVRLVRSGPPL